MNNCWEFDVELTLEKEVNTEASEGKVHPPVSAACHKDEVSWELPLFYMDFHHAAAPRGSSGYEEINNNIIKLIGQ